MECIGDNLTPADDHNRQAAAELTKGLVRVAECDSFACGGMEQPFYFDNVGSAVCAVCDEYVRINTCDWEECFSKWGQDDGDGNIYTWELMDYFASQGWQAFDGQWGLHNTVITSLINAGDETVYLIWSGDDSVNAEESPRDFLPASMVRELDSKFKPDTYVPFPVSFMPTILFTETN